MSPSLTKCGLYGGGVRIAGPMRCRRRSPVALCWLTEGRLVRGGALALILQQFKTLYDNGSLGMLGASRPQ